MLVDHEGKWGNLAIIEKLKEILGNSNALPIAFPRGFVKRGFETVNALIHAPEALLNIQKYINENSEAPKLMCVTGNCGDITKTRDWVTQKVVFMIATAMILDLGDLVVDASNGDNEAIGALAFEVVALFAGGEGEAAEGSSEATKVLDLDLALAENAGIAEKVASIEAKLCFTGETQIYTPNGLIRIDSIREGDSIYSYVESSNSIRICTTSNITKKYTNHLVVLTINGNNINTTPEHPFYTDRGWIKAKDLAYTDSIYTYTNKTTINSKRIVDTTDVAVYNYTVNNSHTYYVSDLIILVHNSCQFFEKYYRGAKSNIRPFKMSDADKSSAMGKDGFMKRRGVSINADKNDYWVQDKGGAWEIDISTIPSELEIIKFPPDKPNGTHFEIVPKEGVKITPEQYQELVDKIKVIPYNATK